MPAKVDPGAVRPGRPGHRPGGRTFGPVRRALSQSALPVLAVAGVIAFFMMQGGPIRPPASPQPSQALTAPAGAGPDEAQDSTPASVAPSVRLSVRAGGTAGLPEAGEAPGSAALPALAGAGMAMVLAWRCAHLLARRRSRAVGRMAATDRAGRRGTDRRAGSFPGMILETLPDAVVVLDRAGMIRSCNAAVRRVFGYAAPDLVGRPLSVLLPRGVAAGGASAEGEAEGRRSDGSTVPLDLAVVPWRDGEARLCTVVLREAAGRRRIEAALRAACDEAEQASRSKSGFLAAACHDLRQPVQSLLLFTAALDDRLKGHAAAGIVAGMRQSLDAHRRLLDALLDISRLDAGVVQPRIAEFPVVTLLDRLGEEYAPQARRKGLRLSVVRSRAWVRSDEALLERILRNLIENALRYTPAGRILIGCRCRRGILAISVSDTGIGIPDGQREAIFEEFRQAAPVVPDVRPPAEGEQGMGLGLAIVRRLARLLGHEVRLRSRPARGSEFAIEVPLAAAGIVPRAERAEARADGRGLALVIDDEAIILDGMRLLLEGWGYGVMTALSCGEALDLLSATRTRPDVILADYRLRENCTGAEAIRRLRSVCGPVPGIVLTGDTAPERSAEARREGFMLLHKPLAPDDLRHLLRQICA